MVIPDLVGQKFARLTVLSRAPNNKHYSAMWLCECECGTEKVIEGKSLRKGDTRSCGCIRKEQSAENARTRKQRSKTDWSTRTEKYCPQCKSDLPVEDFGNNRSSYDGLTAYCRPCHTRQGRESRAKNWGSSRHYHLMHRYGISAEDADNLLVEQGGVCAICQKVPKQELRIPWHVDHDHETGKVRGILCHSCNTALGNFNDDPEILGRALNYLGKDSM